MSTTKCIDVSEWQGNIDFKKVKASGISHVILRAGYGRDASQKDSKFEQNYKNAKAAGMKIGVYWYSYAIDKADAQKEAKACLSVLDKKALDMPVFFDAEESSMTKLGKSTLTSMVRAFCDAIKTGGYRPGVYSNLNWFTNYLDYAGLKKSYPIWLAQYYTEAQLDCDIWQYSSTGSVSGISGNVDMNIIYNTAVVKSQVAQTAPQTRVYYEGAAVQSLLIIARQLGLITQEIKPIDNKVGKMTKAALLQMKKHLGLKEDYSVNLEFITKMHESIVAALPLRGDFNGDGVLNIKDATAIQKEIAGVNGEQ